MTDRSISDQTVVNMDRNTTQPGTGIDNGGFEPEESTYFGATTEHTVSDSVTDSAVNTIPASDSRDSETQISRTEPENNTDRYNSDEAVDEFNASTNQHPSDASAKTLESSNQSEEPGGSPKKEGQQISATSSQQASPAADSDFSEKNVTDQGVRVRINISLEITLGLH